MIPFFLVSRFIGLAAAAATGSPVVLPPAADTDLHPSTPVPSWIDDADVGPAYQAAGEVGRDGWHLQIDGGFTTTENSAGPDEDIEFDEGLKLGLGLMNRTGTENGDRWAFDWGVNALFTDQDANKDNTPPVRDTTVMGLYLQGIVDYAVSDVLSIYGGLGIGPAWLDVGTASDQPSDFSEEDGPFLSWNAQAGLRWWSSPNVAWNLGYRFVNVDNVNLDDGGVDDADFDLETTQHIAEVGVMFHL